MPQETDRKMKNKPKNIKKKANIISGMLYKITFVEISKKSKKRGQYKQKQKQKAKIATFQIKI